MAQEGAQQAVRAIKVVGFFSIKTGLIPIDCKFMFMY